MCRKYLPQISCRIDVKFVRLLYQDEQFTEPDQTTFSEWKQRMLLFSCCLDQSTDGNRRRNKENIEKSASFSSFPWASAFHFERRGQRTEIWGVWPNIRKKMSQRTMARARSDQKRSCDCWTVCKHVQKPLALCASCSLVAFAHGAFGMMLTRTAAQTESVGIWETQSFIPTFEFGGRLLTRILILLCFWLPTDDVASQWREWKGEGTREWTLDGGLAPVRWFMVSSRSNEHANDTVEQLFLPINTTSFQFPCGLFDLLFRISLVNWTVIRHHGWPLANELSVSNIILGGLTKHWDSDHGDPPKTIAQSVSPVHYHIIFPEEMTPRVTHRPV